MGLLEIVVFLLSMLSAIGGWFMRELWSVVKDLKEDLNTLQHSLSKEYTRKEDFKDLRNEILEGLRRVEEKIDRKMDKS